MRKHFDFKLITTFAMEKAPISYRDYLLYILLIKITEMVSETASYSSMEIAFFYL